MRNQIPQSGPDSIHNRIRFQRTCTLCPDKCYKVSDKVHHNNDTYSIMSMRWHLDDERFPPGGAVGRQAWGPLRSPATSDTAYSVPVLMLKAEMMHLIAFIWMLFSWPRGNHERQDSITGWSAALTDAENVI